MDHESPTAFLERLRRAEQKRVRQQAMVAVCVAAMTAILAAAALGLL